MVMKTVIIMTTVMIISKAVKHNINNSLILYTFLRGQYRWRVHEQHGLGMQTWRSSRSDSQPYPISAAPLVERVQLPLRQGRGRSEIAGWWLAVAWWIFILAVSVCSRHAPLCTLMKKCLNEGPSPLLRSPLSLCLSLSLSVSVSASLSLSVSLSLSLWNLACCISV